MTCIRYVLLSYILSLKIFLNETIDFDVQNVSLCPLLYYYIIMQVSKYNFSSRFEYEIQNKFKIHFLYFFRR